MEFNSRGDRQAINNCVRSFQALTCAKRKILGDVVESDWLDKVGRLGIAALRGGLEHRIK